MMRQVRLFGTTLRSATFSVNTTLLSPPRKGSPSETDWISRSALAGAATWSPDRSVATWIPGRRQELPTGGAAVSFDPHDSPFALVAVTRYEYVTLGPAD